jgi:DNA-binding SARP family transcriptional activator
MFVLELLGTLSLRADTRPVPVAAQQKRPLGLLAILALGGRQGISRDRIEAYLWPESSGPLARHSLDQTVYAIRHALGSEVILSTGRELRVNPDLVQLDVWQFEDAIRADQWGAAVGHYKGPLLDGFHFGDSRELESWIDTERARLRLQYQTAIEFLAHQSAEAGDHSQSLTWWRRLANSDPLSADAAKKLMRALAAAGDRIAAVKHARLYQELVRQDLEIEPDSEIESLAATFSHPGFEETMSARRREPHPAVPSSPSDTTKLAPSESGLREASLRELSPRKPLRMKPSRIAAVLSFSVLIVLLIGAVAAENRQRRDHRLGLAENNAARRNSRTRLPAARDSYLRGLNAWGDGSKEGLDTAVVYFRRATEVDHDYAEAYAGLADAYVMLGYFGYRPSDEMFPKAKEAALRSMQLDSTLPSAHPALAYELAWERDFAGADSEFRKAIAFDPTYATAQAIAFDPTYAMAHQWYAILLMILGQNPQAVVASGRAAEQDPFSLNVPVIEVAFTKWITTYPALAGFTSYGPGTIAGQVLNRIDDGAFTHLSARYEVTDPSGSHSFKAVIQGKVNNKTGSSELNGIVTWGWMLGARVRVTFVRVAPCEFGKLNVCFQGILQIQRG